MENKYKDLTNVNYNELLQIQKKASEFLKQITAQYEAIKKVEEENE